MLFFFPSMPNIRFASHMLTAEKLLILLRCNWDEVQFRPTGSATDKPLLVGIN